MSYDHQGQPQDRPPYGYQPPVRQRSEQPTYTVAPAPQPVVVNVVQNAGGSGIIVRRRRTGHWTHFWLTLCTGGLWAPIWIHQTRKHRRRLYVR